MIPQNVLRDFKVVDIDITKHPDYQKLKKEIETLEKKLNEKRHYLIFKS